MTDAESGGLSPNVLLCALLSVANQCPMIAAFDKLGIHAVHAEYDHAMAGSARGGRAAAAQSQR